MKSSNENCDAQVMDTKNLHVYPSEIRAMMEVALRFALTGNGDPKMLERIADEANRTRAEILQKHGVLDIGVPAIRELRDEQ